ncbi:uncharacterized protein ISCGN_018544 [Ixodes scapularis]
MEKVERQTTDESHVTGAPLRRDAETHFSRANKGVSGPRRCKSCALTSRFPEKWLFDVLCYQILALQIGDRALYRAPPGFRWKEERAVRRQLLGNQVQRAPFRPPSRNPSPFPATLGHSSSSVRKGTTATCTPSWSLQARGSALPATTGSKLFVPRQTMKDATRVTRSTTVRRGLDLGSPAKEAGLAAASGATAAVSGASVAARKMAAPEKPRKLAFKENPSFAPAGFQFRGLRPLKPVVALQPWNGQRQGHGSRSCTKAAATGPPPSGGRFVNNENIRGGHHLRPKPVKCPVGNLMDFS